MSPWASMPLEGDADSILSSLEQGLSVGLITTFDPYCCDADDDLKEVVGRENLREFDYVPVKDDEDVVGLLHRAVHVAEDAAGSVRSAMWDLRGDLIISADAGILSYIDGADKNPCRLVLRGSQLDGIVTLSDLQKLPVRSAIFMLITHLELLMSDWIRQRCRSAQDWLDYLPKRGQNIEKQWRKLEKSNLAIDKLTATNFSDKYQIMLKLGSFEDADGCNEDKLYRIKELRNRVAHAGDFALTQETARETIASVGFTRDWIRTLRGGLDDQI